MAAAGKGKQFLLLFWKNWIIQKRNLCCTVAQVVVLVLFSLILVGLRSVTGREEHVNETTWEKFSVDAFPLDFSPRTENVSMWSVAFTPNNEVTRNVMGHVASQLKVNITGQGYESEERLQDALLAETDDAKSILAGVVFDSGFYVGHPIAPHVTYKLRPSSLRKNCYSDDYCSEVPWQTDFQFDPEPTEGPRYEFWNTGYYPPYYNQGFLALQHAIDRAIIMNKSSISQQNLEGITIELKRQPYPAWTRNWFSVILKEWLPFFIMFTFLFTAPCIVKDIVLEKERKLKETLKIMGIANWVQWLAWFAKHFTLLMILVICMTVAYSVKIGGRSVFTYTHPLLLFTFLVTYTVTVIMFAFAISVFFSSANTGAGVTFVLFFLSYVPYFFIDTRYHTLGLHTKLACALSPNIAMAFCCVQMALQETKGVGMQWDNFYKPINVNDDLTMLHTLLMMLFDCFICMLIVWYVDNVKPGEFGVPRPFYFPFMKSYWCGTAYGKDEESITDLSLDPTQHEPLPPNAQSGIRIRGIRKVFGTRSSCPKVAVDNLNLDMMEGQITALLGHNGAGKTTTMFMLTGFLEPTKGNAVVGGYDIRKNLDQVRANLGLCPQHDVLFDSLTVNEHLTFFGTLKGCKDLKKEIDEMLGLLNLKDKKNHESHTLSGGMKRKLSVGIALIGGSKVIILDEPTSGMDPEARRQTWDILQRARRGRTMILTTHFMDEADYLGDRIAIMASGQLVCSGTSLFLKNRYGVGYHMNMVKGEGCEVSAVESLIKQYVPNAALESDAGAELSFVLPHESSGRFEELFNTLEAQKSELGINSWGASVTTMEEVFLKVGQYEENRLNGRGADGEPTTENNENEERENVAARSDTQEAAAISDDVESNMLQGSSVDTMVPMNTGIRLAGQQFVALFLKRVLNSWRSPLITLVQFAVPVVLTILGCLLKFSLPDTANNPQALTLKFDNYDEPIAPYAVDTDNDNEVTNFASKFKNYMRASGAKSYEIDSPANSSQFDNYLLEQANKNKNEYLNSYIVSGTFEDVPNAVTPSMTVLGWFNNEALHSPAMALTAISNSLLRYATGSDDVSIETINHPLPLPAGYKASRDLAIQSVLAFFIAFCVAFGMSFLIASFVIFLIKERTIKAKHCQLTSGASVPIYWLATYLWDIINYLLPTLAIMIVFAIFGIKTFVDGEYFGATLVLFLLYGMAALPFVYLISFLFNGATTGFIVLIIVNILTGSVTAITVLILKLLDKGKEAEHVCYVFLPNFCFFNGLQELTNNYNAKQTCIQLENEVEDRLKEYGFTGEEATFENYCQSHVHPCCKETCGEYCSNYQENPFAWESPGLGRPALFLIVQCVMYFIIICLLESGIGKKLKQIVMSKIAVAIHKDPTTPTQAQTPQVQTVTVSQGHHELQRTISLVAEEDDDVAAERERICNVPLDALLHKAEALLMKNVKKYYGGLLAVDRLTLGIKEGECFGLLGVNGAGKTTTFKMLTGDEFISQGEAYVKGFSVGSEIKKVQKHVGYCPQFDALIEELTVKETLYMFGRLRGVPERRLQSAVLTMIEKLVLSEYADKLCGTLSGGNKRKVSTAIALTGSPSVVFLDEPTTGVDPMARRQVWNTLGDMRESGMTIVLTSHSMEECEALCSRMVIMVNGQFKCLGSSQHLKDKFGEGFSLMAKVTPGVDAMETHKRTMDMMGFIEYQFSGCVLKDMHPGLVLYQISSTNTTLAQVFGLMERHKGPLLIEDYSVSQTTLEQVFINFARAQQPPRQNTMICGCERRGLFCCLR